MVIVKIQGGLGNQMFQYSLFLKLRSMWPENQVALYYQESEQQKRDANMVWHIFHLDAPMAERKLVEKYRDDNMDFFSKVRRTLLGGRSTHLFDRENSKFNSQVLERKNVYLEGYWQAEKYFAGCEDAVRKAFTFPKLADVANQQMMRQIQTTCSVSLHIRRGDYLLAENQELFGNICTDIYYQKAVEYFRQKYREVRFFVFTNDSQWVQENFDLSDMTLVEINDETHGYRDLQLMSACRHHILANSSFSWWGAWLGDNQDKEVVAPDRWLNGRETPDIWCDGWIRISGS